MCAGAHTIVSVCVCVWCVCVCVCVTTLKRERTRCAEPRRISPRLWLRCKCCDSAGEERREKERAFGIEWDCGRNCTDAISQIDNCVKVCGVTHGFCLSMLLFLFFFRGEGGERQLSWRKAVGALPPRARVVRYSCIDALFVGCGLRLPTFTVERCRTNDNSKMRERKMGSRRAVRQHPARIQPAAFHRSLDIEYFLFATGKRLQKGNRPPPAGCDKYAGGGVRVVFLCEG